MLINNIEKSKNNNLKHTNYKELDVENVDNFCSYTEKHMHEVVPFEG